MPDCRLSNSEGDGARGRNRVSGIRNLFPGDLEFRLKRHPAAGTDQLHRHASHRPPHQPAVVPLSGDQREGDLKRTPVGQGAEAAVRIVKRGGEEVQAAEIVIPASGKALQLDLHVTSDELLPGRGSGQTGALGGLCGSVGLISFAWMAMGLALMRTTRRR